MMYAYFIILLVAIPFGTLVSAQGFASKSPARGVARRASKTYLLQDLYDADNFFSEWDFFTGPDPAHSNVNYLSLKEAQAKKLAYVDKNTTILAVDSTSNVLAGGKRDSVRITSRKTYTEGLFILDASAMPVGCGIQPSFLTKGARWPVDGEIDIVQGVNNQAQNQMTLHAGTSSCRLAGNATTINGTTGSPTTSHVPTNHATTSTTPTSHVTAKKETTANKATFTGHVLGTNCSTSSGNLAGCSILDKHNDSFGPAFNTIHGGVYALLWDVKLGISMWLFPRSEIPKDIIDKKPTPHKWGTPAGFWSPASCDIASNFHNHQLVIDITICGGWAGSPAVYAKSGCPATCSAMVANASNFADAKWIINSVSVYN